MNRTIGFTLAWVLSGCSPDPEAIVLNEVAIDQTLMTCDTGYQYDLITSMTSGGHSVNRYCSESSRVGGNAELLVTYDVDADGNVTGRR